jgi:hypothetical protein
MSERRSPRQQLGGAAAASDHLRQHETTVAAPALGHVILWIGLALLGAGAAWLLKSVVGWVASLSWVPFVELIQLIDELLTSIGEPWATIGALVLGGLGGLVLAFLIVKDSLTVTVSDTQVSMTRGDYSAEVERAQVSALFLDGDKLVVLGHGSEELAAVESDLLAEDLKDAFLSHEYPWLEGGDPYQDEYRLWVEDTPDLPASDNALLKARARALARGDEGKDDAIAIRVELAKLGIVLRDEGKRQYWRFSKDRRSG